MHAHTPNGEGIWHDLSDHLRSVALLARRHAAPFAAGDIGYLLGLWHDLGKVNPAFQDYLKAAAEGRHTDKVPHAAWAAALAYDTLYRRCKQEEYWKRIAVPMMAHHTELQQPERLAQQLCTFFDDHPAARDLMAPYLARLPKAPVSTTGTWDSRDLFTRMIFSALTDADYLDTERHFDSSRATARGEWTRPSDLWHVFRPDQLRLMWNGRGASRVNRVRRQVYFASVQAAKKPPGVFRLTVPTGGGKTRAALAFALSHAVEHAQHGFRRVIVALPYTSIIDQVAGEYRHIFGERLVLEHHSQVDCPLGEEQDEKSVRQRLATENWDHPLIVTTTVQLFESLFSNTPSRCRKLHNIARSILILDEVQTLPPELLEPTLDMLRALVDGYGVTVVLCTATQPAFDQTPYLAAFNGLCIHEIVPRPERYFLDNNMKRVEYQPVRQLKDLEELAEQLCEPEAGQCLVVLNTRKHALALHDELRQRNVQGLYHLSTLLCGAHRRRLLTEIKQRLNPLEPKPVRLISTQVVEAGVDLDFPIVYRAMGPLDRIVQVAGRCNREGRLKDATGQARKGQVTIIDWPENASPPGAYKIGLDDAKILLLRNNPERLHEPALHTEYFQCLFRDVDLDTRGIQPYRRDLDFPEVAKRYKIIEDTVPVVIPKYDDGEGEKRLQAHLRAPSRDSWRCLLPYVVNIRQHDVNQLLNQDWLEEVNKGLYRWRGDYDDKTHRGIVAGVYDPTDLIG